MATNMEHTIDATGKTLGRVATLAAIILRGKDEPTFERHIPGTATVKIINASKAKFDENRLKERYHKHYSGHPGGMKVETLARTAEKKGYSELFRKAVMGMLPPNKLRPVMMKNLIVTE